MKRLNRIGIILILMSVVLLWSCNSYQRLVKKNDKYMESTGRVDGIIKVEYHLEILDEEFCKIYSLSTGKYYIIECDSIHEVLLDDNI